MTNLNNCALIIGESGTGKSTSLRNLDPKETFIINVLGKPLPFRGSQSRYTAFTNESRTGNLYKSDDAAQIVKVITFISSNRLEIKTLVIDDFTYIMANEFMARSREKGWDKFNDFAYNSWAIFYEIINNVRDDLTCFVLCHSDTKSDGLIKTKTIGKLTDNMVNIEGMFTCVFHSVFVNSEYKFMTNRDETHIAKTPLGMFDELYIDNDLALIQKKMTEYLAQDAAPLELNNEDDGA